MSLHIKIGALVVFLAATAARADLLPLPVRVFHAEGSRLALRVLEKDRLARGWTAVRSRPPHRLVNPESRTLVFEGPELRKLLPSRPLARSRYVYAIGADGYVSMIPADVVRRHPVILALRREGQGLTPQLGEQQVVFPTEGKGGVPELYAKTSAYWTWYVRAVVVGELPDRLGVGDRQVPVSPERSDAAVVAYAPPSIVKIDDRACPRLEETKLSTVPGLEKARSLRIHSLHKDGDAPVAAAGYRLLKAPAAASSALPVECGGPFILVKPGRAPVKGEYGPDDLVFFVYRIDPVP